MRFFGSMGAVAILMRCRGGGGTGDDRVLSDPQGADGCNGGRYNAEFLNVLASNAAGLVIVAVIPSIAANWSCAALSRKDSLYLKSAFSAVEEENNSRKIQLIRSATGDTKQIELLNPDFMD